MSTSMISVELKGFYVKVINDSKRSSKTARATLNKLMEHYSVDLSAVVAHLDRFDAIKRENYVLPSTFSVERANAWVDFVNALEEASKSIQ